MNRDFSVLYFNMISNLYAEFMSLVHSYITVNYLLLLDVVSTKISSIWKVKGPDLNVMGVILKDRSPYSVIRFINKYILSRSQQQFLEIDSHTAMICINLIRPLHDNCWTTLAMIM